VLTGTPALTDQRGKFTAALYVVGSKVYDCLSNGSHESTMFGMNQAQLNFYASPGPDQLGLPDNSGGSLKGFAASSPSQPLPAQWQHVLNTPRFKNHPDARARLERELRLELASSNERNAFGLAGSGVSAVSFVFADGTTVNATVQNGWYFAWWPSDDYPTSVRVATSSAIVTSPMMPTGGQGAGCRFGTSGCVWAGLRQHPRTIAPTRKPAPTEARTISSIESVPTLHQLLENFAVLRHPQSAPDRSWKPQCECTARQLNKLTRLAVRLPGGYRVFFDVEQFITAGQLSRRAGSYVLNLDIVNPDGNTSSYSFGPSTQYGISPISSADPRAKQGTSKGADNVYAAIVPDGVSSVSWTFGCPRGQKAKNCTAFPSRTFTVPVINNVAAKRLPGIGNCPICAQLQRIVWRSSNRQVLTSFGGYGGVAAPPFVSGHLGSGTLRLLTSDSIGNVRVGQNVSTVISTLTNQFGAPTDTNLAVASCRIDYEAVWESPAVANPLTIYERHGRFVGYRYGPPENQFQITRGPGAVLESESGLSLGETVRTARRLYPHGFATRVSRRDGYWSSISGGSKLYGSAIPHRYPVRRVGDKDLIATIEAGNTGCQQ
jgi:hypothetical protein